MSDKKPDSRLMRALVGTDKVIFTAARWATVVAAVGVIVVAVLATADVLSTKLFRSSIKNVTDLITYLNVPIVFLSIAFVQINGGHVDVTLLKDGFPRVIQRIISIGGCILGFAVTAFAGWRGWLFSGEKLTNLTTSSSASSAFVIWPFAYAMTFGYFLLAVCFLWSIVRELFIPREYWNREALTEDEGVTQE